MSVSRISTIAWMVLCLSLAGPGNAWPAAGDGSTEGMLTGEEEAGEELGEELGDELDDEFALLQEEDLVYSAAKHEQDWIESPSTITVIPRERIERTHCRDVICLLRQLPEVDVRRIYPLWASVGSRALTGEMADRAIMLIDGRDTAMDVFGMPWWQDDVLHLDDIERIEVIRGPGSALYGANAHSLVVSITTRPIRDGAAVFLGGGEGDLSQIHLRLGQIWGDWRLGVSGGYETTGHYGRVRERQNEVGRFMLKLETTLGPGEAGLQAGIITAEGLNYVGLAPAWVDDGLRTFGMLFYRSDWLRAQLWASTTGGAMTPILPLYYGDTKLGEMPKDVDFFGSSLDGDVQATFTPWTGNLILTGLNYRWLTYLSDDNDPPEAYQHRLGVYLQDEQRLWDELIVTAGARFDWNSMSPWSISPRAALLWRYRPDQVVRAAFGQAFRQPSFLNSSLHMIGVVPEPAFPELVEFFKNAIGNEDLRNERVTSFELGYRGRFFSRGLEVEATGFFNLYRDTINFQASIATNSFGFPDLSRSVLRFNNTGREADSGGGSLSLVGRPWEGLELFANYTYRYTWFTDEPPPGASSGQAGKGERVPWEAAHLLNAGVNLSLESGPRLGLAVHARSASDLDWPEDGDIFAGTEIVHNPAVAFVSAYAAWRLEWDGHWTEIGLRVHNLFNAPFRDTAGLLRVRDGVMMGGEFLDRRVLLFLRGEW